MTKEKYLGIRRNIEEELNKYVGHNGVSVTLMYDDRFMLLSDILLELISVINPIIEADTANIVYKK